VPDGPAGVVAWEDGFRGRQEIDAARELGDFVIAKGDGTPAYQLAVVVDDASRDRSGRADRGTTRRHPVHDLGGAPR